MKYTFEEKMFMYKKYMSLGCQTLVQRAWMTKYVCSTPPNWSTIMMTAKQFEKTGSVINLHSRKRNYPQKVMSEKPSLSIRKASQIAKILFSLTRLVFKNDLGLKPYKKPDLHEMETNNYPKSDYFPTNVFR
jgi:hypothetical protein